MKKIIVFVASLLASFTASAALPTGEGEFEVKVPLLHPAFEIGGSALFIKNSMPELDYAFLSPVTADGTLITEGGRYKSARPRYKFGWEAYFGYIFPCSGTDLRLVWTQFEETVNHHVSNTDSVIFPTVVSPLDPLLAAVPAITATVNVSSGETTLEFPGTTIFGPAAIPLTGTIFEADVKSTVRQGSVDLELGQFINVDTFVRLRTFYGLRYSRLKNYFNANYVIGGFASTQTVTIGPFEPGDVLATSTLFFNSTSEIQELILQSSKFNGIGPRLGMEGSFHIGGGFGFVGRLSTALLVGEAQSALSKVVNGTIDLQLVDVITTSLTPGFIVTTDDFAPPIGTIFSTPFAQTEFFDHGRMTRIVPNIEAKIGIDYTSQFKNCRTLNLEIGYFVNHYFNGLDRLSEVGAFSPESRTRHAMDVSFSGPYIEVEVTI